MNERAIPWKAIAGGLTLVMASSLVTVWVMNRPSRGPVEAPVAAGPAVAQHPPIGGINLSADEIARAGIVIGKAEDGGTSQLRVPGTVEPNAYRSVVVTPIAPGRVTSVAGVLGEHVRQGQPLAQIHSPELADAQRRYLSVRAELDAHERELRRTERLVEIGSASRQELEKIHAEHTAAVAMVQSEQSRLTLLGMTAEQIRQLASPADLTSAMTIVAPADGVITERAANVGVNVDTTTKLFTIVDMSTVWVVGNLYERDLGRVRLGTPVTVTVPGSQIAIEGKVNYLDPQINVATRTAQMRVEVPNRDGRLRLGMYAEMLVRDVRATTAISIPREAVQIVGDRAVVYVADPTAKGLFNERDVRIGPAMGDSVELLDGLQTGEPVVTKGSFALRAEFERRGGHQPADTSQASSNAQAVRVEVSDKGFEPSRITLSAGRPARLEFVRTSDATCATEVVIPALKIKRSLPLNQPVEVVLTGQKPGEISFACGMDMFEGTLVVK
jgi:RND family efflux transporter MFP subunit